VIEAARGAFQAGKRYGERVTTPDPADPRVLAFHETRTVNVVQATSIIPKVGQGCQSLIDKRTLVANYERSQSRPGNLVEPIDPTLIGAE
jgi:hypothetical protein